MLFAVGGGCSDSTTAADMTMSTPDMAMTMDMTSTAITTCKGAEMCAAACILNAAKADPVICATGCGSSLTGTPKADFQALFGCILQACGTPDGGVATFSQCAGGSIMSGGACATAYGTCGSN